MKKHPEYNNLLQFDILNSQSGIEHFCTTRQGGVSKGSFSSLNLGNYSDDSPMAIFENRQILSRMWYMDISDFIIPHQTHSYNVLVIDEAFMSARPSDKIEALYGVDASITHLNNIFLCATTADCVPILLYDNQKHIIAAIHAGWKSLVGGIIENTVHKMIEVYSTNPLHIVAAIGPSISQKNYEVGDELIAQFNEAGFDLSKASFFNEQTNKWHIDLKLLSHNQLVLLGVNPQQIETSTLCTYDESELFFSARRQSIVSGRMLSGIKLVD